MQNRKISTENIYLPLMGGLVLLLFFVLFSTSFQIETTDALTEKNPPTVQKPYMHASTAATVAPIRNWRLEDPIITADAAIVIDDISGTARPLFAYNSKKARPLASIIKLLTALTAVDFIDLEDNITITRSDIDAPENAGGLFVGENISMHDLLAALLIESSNDAAHALARTAGNGSIDAFVLSMNEKAYSMGLHSLIAADPMGISPETKATALDTARLLHTANAHPVIKELLSMRSYSTSSHTFTSTHQLFTLINDITAAKTGFTEEAGQNLVLQRRMPNGRIITSVVLGSQDREGDTIALQRWIEEAFHYNTTP